MKVCELIERLRTMPPDARVVFDTEATEWQVHCVPVDGCDYETPFDAVVLSTGLPHGGGN